MKSIIRKRTYEAIYRLLDRVSPLPYDCGSLCGAACCVPEEQQDPQKKGPEQEADLGIYLLPGEEKMFDRRESWLRWSAQRAESFDFPASWTGKVYFIRCLDPPECPRGRRPLQCRFFPLSPYLTDEGILRLIRYPGALPYRCPLIAEQLPLNDDFVRATYTVWKHLLRDPLIYDLVEMDSEDYRQDGIKLDYVW